MSSSSYKLPYKVLILSWYFSFILFQLGTYLLCENNVIPIALSLTFETLLILILGYLLSIPISIFTFYNLTKKFKNENSQDDHEDIL